MTKTPDRAHKQRSGRRPGPKGWIAAGLTLAVVVAAAVALVTVGGAAEDRPENAAPDIALPSFDGETVRIADFQGQGLVVNYWASWCLPCLVELPGFEQVHQQYRGDVAFLGINLADDPTSARAVVADTGITYPLAVDADGASFAEFGAFAMPTTIFIGPNGGVIEMYSGDLTAAQLEAKIIEHFGA